MVSRRATGTGILILICALLSLALPVGYFIRLDSEIRAVDSIRAYPGHPEIAALEERGRSTRQLLFRGVLIGELIVTFTLSLLTCLVIRWRTVGADQPRGVGRVLSDIGLLVAFFLAPWLARSVGFFELPSGNPLDLWVMSGLWRNAMPCVAAMFAGLLFAVSVRWHQRPSRAV